MDFAKALTFPFDDDEWLKKIGIGVLIPFIPVVGAWVLQGWSLEISQRTKHNNPPLLPAWDAFGEYLGNGFKLFVAGLIYQLPTALFVCIIAASTSFGAAEGGEELGAVLGILAALCGCLIFLYSIVAAIVFFGGYVRFIDVPELGTFFSIGENLAIVRSNFGDFAMALLFIIGASFLVSIAASITIGLGSLLIAPFMAYFAGHILGQLAIKVQGAPAPQV